MRQIVLILTVVIGTLGVSCKKNYTCTCVNIPYSGPQATDLVGKLTKKNAKLSCDAIYKSLTVKNSTTSCDIK